MKTLKQEKDLIQSFLRVATQSGLPDSKVIKSLICATMGMINAQSPTEKAFYLGKIESLAREYYPSKRNSKRNNSKLNQTKD